MTRPLPTLGAARALPALPLHTLTLSNGMPVFTVERRDLPMVDVQMVFRFGAEVDDAAASAGRLNMTAEMLDEGTTTRDAHGIAEEIDYLGAHLDIAPGYDATTASLHVLSPRLEPALDILADVMLNPSFPEDEFGRKQREHIVALQQDADEAGIVATKALAAGVFGAHPYGVPLAGTTATLERMQLEALVELYNERFHPGNAMVLVVGDVDAQQIGAALEKRFGRWPARAALNAELPLATDVGGRRVLLVDKPGAAQAELRVGHTAPRRNTDDYFPLMVLNTILGGSFTSRLNTILRERMGVTYGASSRFRMRRAGGAFTAAAAVFTESAARSARVVIEEMERLIQEPVDAAELLRAQSYVALGLPRSFETTEDIAAHVREQLLYALPADYWQTYVQRVFAVTADDVRAAAARHLHPDHATIVVVADRSEVQAALENEKLGAVEITSVEI